MDPHRRFRDPRLAEVFVAELRHHICDAFLVVLRPQKRERNAGFCKFCVNALVVRLHTSGCRCVFFWGKNALKILIADVAFERPFDSLGVGGFQHLFDGVVRASYTRRYLPLTVKFR